MPCCADAPPLPATVNKPGFNRADHIFRNKNFTLLGTFASQAQFAFARVKIGEIERDQFLATHSRGVKHADDGGIARGESGILGLCQASLHKRS